MLSGLFSHSAAGAADFSHLEQASVEFRHVDKRYGDHQVLNDINLTITPGEVVAILGPSGSGKSTLIRLINQLETLSGGEILVDNKPTGALSGTGLRQLRSRVGFVFQQFNLYAHLTASQNITLALEHVHGWKPQPAQNARWLCWRRSECWKKPTISRPNFPVDSSSAWQLPALWPHRRKSFCSTSPRLRSIRK